MHCKCGLLGAHVCCLSVQDCGQTRAPSSLLVAPHDNLADEMGYVASAFSIWKRTWPHRLNPVALRVVCTFVWDCTDDCHPLTTTEKNYRLREHVTTGNVSRMMKIRTGFIWLGMGSSGEDILCLCVAWIFNRNEFTRNMSEMWSS
jgi:hypothetical protein